MECSYRGALTVDGANLMQVTPEEKFRAFVEKIVLPSIRLKYKAPEPHHSQNLNRLCPVLFSSENIEIEVETICLKHLKLLR